LKDEKSFWGPRPSYERDCRNSLGQLDLFSVSAPTTDKVIDDKNNHGAYDGDEHAVEVQPADTFSAKERKDPTADDRPDDAEHDIQHHSLAFLVHNPASDKARNQAENDPTNDGHDFLLNFKTELIEERPNAIFVQEFNALTSILPVDWAGEWTVSQTVFRLVKALLLNRNIEFSAGAFGASKAELARGSGHNNRLIQP
jgi:hypothetical protein